MNKQQFEERERTRRKFMDLTGGTISYEDMGDLIDRLHRKESSLAALNTLLLNEKDTDLRNRARKVIEKIEKDVKLMSDLLGFKVYFSGEPAVGSGIRFILPDGSYNNFDGESWCINW